MQKYTVHQFNEDFPDDNACLDFLVREIYPEGIPCRTCAQPRKHHKLRKRKAYSCDHCGTHVYPMAGTVFEKSRTRLKSWFYAIYLMSSTRCGISAKQLERELGVTYKTAWRIFKQIRALLGEEIEKLSGEVEADEVYYGGKRRNEPGRPGEMSNKIPIVGVVQRGGKVAALVTKDASKKSIRPIFKERVLPGTMVYTDKWKGYDLLQKAGYKHERIPHDEKVYVIGNVHTNTIEGFWSHLKRSLAGAHRSVSTKYLQHYINEHTFRYNHRDDRLAMHKAFAARIPRVRAGRYGKYSPVGK